MKYRVLLVAALAMLALTSCGKEVENNPAGGNDTTPDAGLDTVSVAVDGCLPGLFSVGPDKRVYFSQGNLQWSASGSHVTADGSTKPGTWRFATHQYDMVGSPSQHNGSEAVSPFNGYPGNVDSSDNAFLAEDCTGWTDLFAWATSGFNELYPYTISASRYGSAGNGGLLPNEDWGGYNAISNGGNVPGRWRTLTAYNGLSTWGEWNYLLCERSASTVNGHPNARYATICVLKGSDRISGLLLFPDTFAWPSDAGTAPSNINAAEESGSWQEVPSYTLAQFAALERAGCVFLPAAGRRNGTNVECVGYEGYYWSSYGYYDEVRHYAAYYSYFSPRHASVGESTLSHRGVGMSVRLVQDAE